MAASLSPLALHAWNYSLSSLRSGALPGLALVAAYPVSNLVTRYAFYPDLEKMNPNLLKGTKAKQLTDRLKNFVRLLIITKVPQLCLQLSLSTLKIKKKYVDLASLMLPVLAASYHIYKHHTSDEKKFSARYWSFQSASFAILAGIYYLHYGLPAAFYLLTLSNISFLAQRHFLEKRGE